MTARDQHQPASSRVDRGVRDGVLLLVRGENVPSVVQAPVAGISPYCCFGGRGSPSCLHDLPGSVGAVVDDAMPQQQLRQPMPCRHQLQPGVVTRTDQVTGGFLRHGRDANCDELVHSQQPCEQDRISRVGLDSISSGPDNLRRRRDRHRNSRYGQRPGQAEPGRTGLINRGDRPMLLRDSRHPQGDSIAAGRELRLNEFPGRRVQRRRPHAARVHIQPNRRTLIEHQGLRCMSASQATLEMIHESAP